MRRRAWIGIGFVVVIVITALLLWFSRAPALSSVQSRSCIASADACLRFPLISGENLPGQAFSLPADFAGTRTLVIVPFDEAQQVNASTWLPLARELAQSQPDFAYDNLPVFPGMSAPVRAFIRAGMNLTIPDAELRSLTITVFLDDRDAFLAALNIPDIDAMQVFLLNADGDVIWRGAGEFTSEQGDSLRAALAG
ncbi:MAG: hypothetical protein ABI835_00300 [Chloroflexota bacterium]